MYGWGIMRAVEGDNDWHRPVLLIEHLVDVYCLLHTTESRTLTQTPSSSFAPFIVILEIG